MIIGSGFRVQHLGLGLWFRRFRLGFLGHIGEHADRAPSKNWVAVKELNLSYYVGETLLFTIYTHSGNLI